MNDDRGDSGEADDVDIAVDAGGAKRRWLHEPSSPWAQLTNGAVLWPWSRGASWWLSTSLRNDACRAAPNSRSELTRWACAVCWDSRASSRRRRASLSRCSASLASRRVRTSTISCATSAVSCSLAPFPAGNGSWRGDVGCGASENDEDDGGGGGGDGDGDRFVVVVVVFALLGAGWAAHLGEHLVELRRILHQVLRPAAHHTQHARVTMSCPDQEKKKKKREECIVL